MAIETYGTLWVCGNCLHHHANGECGDCYSDHGHDEEPLSAIERPFYVTEGMSSDDHASDCLLYILSDLKANYPDMAWPSIPGDYACDCETIDHSRSSCDGCNSWLHGERHAMTLFKVESPE